MDWNLYKDLQRQERELNVANPVTVEVTWNEYEVLKYGVLLLRRIAGNTGDQDLNVVDDAVTSIASKVNAAFRNVPGTEELRAEQMRMLIEEREKHEHPAT